jgi:hypothetical protein
MTERTKSEPSHVLQFGGGLAVPVPEDEAAEDEALLAHPGFQARLVRARANKREGRGVPADEVDRYFENLEAREFSGSLRVRMPKHLHRDLVQQAERDNVSLNTLIVALLERGVGALSGPPSAARE